MLKNNTFLENQSINEANLNDFLDFLNLLIGCDCNSKYKKKKNQHQQDDFFHYLRDSDKLDTAQFDDWIRENLMSSLVLAFNSFLKNHLNSKILFEFLFNEKEIEKKFISSHFEKHIYHCLEAIILHRNATWISHACESQKINNLYFPEHHWTIKNKTTLIHYDDLFSVNVGYLPFSDCLMEHMPGPQKTSPTNNFDNNIIGIMPKQKILSSKWEVVPSPKESFGRNHLFIQKNNNPMPIKNWVFLYTTKESVKFINTQKANIINIKLFNKFYQTQKNLLSKICLLKVI